MLLLTHFRQATVACDCDVAATTDSTLVNTSKPQQKTQTKLPHKASSGRPILTAYQEQQP